MATWRLGSLPKDESPGPPRVEAGHLDCSGEGLAALVNVLHGAEGLVVWCSLFWILDLPYFYPDMPCLTVVWATISIVTPFLDVLAQV